MKNSRRARAAESNSKLSDEPQSKYANKRALERKRLTEASAAVWQEYDQRRKIDGRLYDNVKA